MLSEERLTEFNKLFFRIGINAEKTRSKLKLMAIGMIALVIISSIGTLYIGSASALGWTTVGFASAVFALDLSLRRFNKRKLAFAINVLSLSSFIALGALAGTGHLSTGQLGWALVPGIVLMHVPYFWTPKK